MTTAWERTGRPKPPRIYSREYFEYQRAHRTYAIYKGARHWGVYHHEGFLIQRFRTHQEATNYMQFMAQLARKDTR